MLSDPDPCAVQQGNQQFIIFFKDLLRRNDVQHVQGQVTGLFP